MFVLASLSDPEATVSGEDREWLMINEFTSTALMHI